RATEPRAPASEHGTQPRVAVAGAGASEDDRRSQRARHGAVSRRAECPLARRSPEHRHLAAESVERSGDARENQSRAEGVALSATGQSRPQNDAGLDSRNPAEPLHPVAEGTG